MEPLHTLGFSSTTQLLAHTNTQAKQENDIPDFSAKAKWIIDMLFSKLQTSRIIWPSSWTPTQISATYHLFPSMGSQKVRSVPAMQSLSSIWFKIHIRELTVQEWTCNFHASPLLHWQPYSTTSLKQQRIYRALVSSEQSHMPLAVAKSCCPRKRSKLFAGRTGPCPTKGGISCKQSGLHQASTNAPHFHSHQQGLGNWVHGFQVQNTWGTWWELNTNIECHKFGQIVWICLWILLWTKHRCCMF